MEGVLLGFSRDPNTLRLFRALVLSLSLSFGRYGNNLLVGYLVCAWGDFQWSDVWPVCRTE